MPLVRRGPIYNFFIEWDGPRASYRACLVAEKPDGTRVDLIFQEKELPEHGVIDPGAANWLIYDMPDDQVRQLLQTIVDGAAKIGVVAANAQTEARAAKEHLRDMRRLAFGLLGNMGVKFDIPER